MTVYYSEIKFLSIYLGVHKPWSYLHASKPTTVAARNVLVTVFPPPLRRIEDGLIDVA